MGGTITINGMVTTTNTVLAGAGLSGSGSFSGLLTWISGQFAPGGTLTIATNGVLTINGSTTLQIYGALTNAGTVNWVGGALRHPELQRWQRRLHWWHQQPGGRGVQRADAIKPLAVPAMGMSISTTRELVRKSATVNATAITVPFNNTGTVDVQSGTLSLNRGGTGSGSYIAEAGATLAVGNGYLASTNAVFSGAGTNLWMGGTITINGTVMTTNSILAGAGLSGSGSFSGGLTWISGEFAPGGTLTIATNGMLTINGSTTLQMYGALTNAGTVNWVGGAFVIQNANGANGGYIGGINNLPGAVFNVQCDQTIGCACYGYEYFNNAGMVRKSASASTAVDQCAFQQSGTVDVQSGTLSLSGSGSGGGSFIAESRGDVGHGQQLCR